MLSLTPKGLADKKFSSCQHLAETCPMTHLLRGVPFSLNGPVTRRRPVSSCFRTTTRFPLWTPARTMATVPADRDALTALLCFEKKLTEVPLAGLHNKSHIEKRNGLYGLSKTNLEKSLNQMLDISFIWVSDGTS